MDAFTIWTHIWAAVLQILKWGTHHIGLVFFLVCLSCAIVELFYKTWYYIQIKQLFNGHHKLEAFSLVGSIFSVLIFVLLLIWRYRETVYYIP